MEKKIILQNVASWNFFQLTLTHQSHFVHVLPDPCIMALFHGSVLKKYLHQFLNILASHTLIIDNNSHVHFHQIIRK